MALDTTTEPLHRGAFCQFPFQWIYFYGSNKSTWKETGKTHLCVVPYFPPPVDIGSIEYSIHLYSSPCLRDPNCGSKISGRSHFSLDDRTWETFRKNQSLIIIWWLSSTFYFGCLPCLSDVKNFVWTHLVKKIAIQQISIKFSWNNYQIHWSSLKFCLFVTEEVLYSITAVSDQGS